MIFAIARNFKIFNMIGGYTTLLQATEMSDRVLVETIKTVTDEKLKKELKEALYHRYEKFVHKHWHTLTKQLNASVYLTTLKDDFYNDSYITFANALEAVNPGKIENDKWKFLGYYGFYLSNQRKLYAKKVIQKHRTEVSMEISTGDEETVNLADLSTAGKVPSTEEEFFKEDYRSRFWKALTFCRGTLWDPISRAIFDLRAEEKPIRQVCSSLNISSWRYNKLLTTMKAQLEYYIEHPKEITLSFVKAPTE